MGGGLRFLAMVFWCHFSGIVGAELCLSTFGAWERQRILAEHPGEYICGLFAMPYLFLGYVTGAAAGAVIWGAALIWWRIRNGRPVE